MSVRLAVCLLLSAALQTAVSPYRDSLRRFEFQQLEMGTLFRIVVYSSDGDLAEAAARRAFARIERLDARLSDYRPDSELNRLSAEAAPVVVSPDLFRVLEESVRFSRLSGGAFDVTVRPLVKLWEEAGRRGQLPAAAEMASASARVGYRKIVLNRMLRSVRTSHPETEIDLGGIAKGYAADEALAVLAESGLTRALVDAGGDVRLGAPPAERRAWKVRIEGDGAAGELALSNCAVATSGDLHRYREIGGIRYSHIVDPRSGQALRESRLVTVIAPDAMTADALATALSVLSIPEARALVKKVPGVAAKVSAAGKAVAVILSAEGANPFPN